MRYAALVHTATPGRPQAFHVRAARWMIKITQRQPHIGASVYFAVVTLVFAWPATADRSSNVVSGVQSRLWPWRGVVSSDQPLFPQRDGAVSSFPWSVTYHDAIRRGEFPLWDWHSFAGGYDLSSDGVSGVMYPFHWLVWAVFSPAAAHDAFTILHLWLGGLAMYCLLRHWRLSSVASTIGGTVWMLSAYNVIWLQAEMITPVLVVVPLAFWRISCAIRQGTFVNRLLAAIAIGLGLVAGNIVVFLVVAWLVGLYGVAVVVRGQLSNRDGQRLKSQIGTLAFASIGAFCLSAYSLVPTLGYLLTLGRQTASRADASVVQATVRASVEDLWNSPLPILPNSDIFTLGWCGRVGLLLAVVGMMRRHRGQILAIALAVYFTLLPTSSLLISIGWYTIPPLRAVSGFGRLLFLASFGVAILAGIGADYLVRAGGAIFRGDVGWLRVRVARRMSGAILLGAVVFEMLPFAIAASPPWVSRQGGSFFPETGAARAIAEVNVSGGWPSLVLPISGQGAASADPAVGWSGISFWGSTAHAASIDSVGGYDSAVPWRAASLARVMQGTVIGEAVRGFGGAYLPSFSVGWSRLDLMRRVGVTHVYAPPGVALEDSAYFGWMLGASLVYEGSDGRVWAIDGSQRLPRVVELAVVAPSAEDALVTLVSADFDPASSTVLEAGDGPVPVGVEASAAGGTDLGGVRSSKRGSNSAAVDVRLNRDAWLVTPIGFSNGWSAQVDGRDVETRAADFGFTAVRVGQGDHRVTFSYRPPGFLIGAALTSLALLGVGTAGVVAVCRHRRFRDT